MRTRQKPFPIQIKAPAEPTEDPLLKLVVDSAWSKKARDIIAIDVREHTFYSDFVLICSGSSDRHVRAIHEELQAAAREAGLPAPSVEGDDLNRWVLLDYGHLIVHVFYSPLRDVYELERLWADAPRIPLELAHDPTEATDDWD